MSTLKAKIANATTRSPSRSPRSSVDLSANLESDKYRLLITAGPSYDTSTHKIVQVNGNTPTPIENDFISAKIKVRIHGYRGLPSTSPANSPYFDDPAHEKDQYSVAFSFVPKRDLESVDAVFGNDFDHPVRDRLPPGFNTAFRIVKEFIDPGLECDAYADEPWLYGPALSCWFGFQIGDKLAEGSEIPEAEEAADILKEGAVGSGKKVREQHGLPDSNEKRRKHFLTASNREAFTFEKDRLYSADFFNPYLDFGNFALKLPGFSIKVIKYIDEKSHCLRYVFKNRKTGDVYFCINFNLLWGEQLEKAMRKDGKGEEEMKAWAGAEEEEVDGQAEKAEGDREESSSAAKAATEGPELPPDLIDKPASVREQMQDMSISDTLRETSASGRTGSKGRVLDNDVD